MRAIESITLVPMTKESIFDVPFEEFEFDNVTSDKQVWFDFLASRVPGKYVNYGDGCSVDDLLQTFGPEINRVKYFALAPVGRFGYETFEVMSRIHVGDEVSAARFLRDLIDEHSSNLILSEITKDRYQYDIPRWKFRYAIKGVKSYETIFGESNEVAERHFHKKSIGKSVAPPPPIRA